MSNIGRVSTSMFYQQAGQQISNGNSLLYSIQNQLATGKKINRPSEDPLAAAQISVAKDLKTQNDAYLTAVNAAKTSVNTVSAETTRIINTLQSLNELAVSTRNGSFTTTDLQAKGAQARALVNDLVDSANAQDGTGNFLFSGSSVGVKPFQFNGSNYTYNGDQTNLFIKTGSSDVVQTGWNGDAIFNGFLSGDGYVNASATNSNQGNVFVSDVHATTPAAYAGGSYQLNFTVSAMGVSQYSITDTATATQVVAPTNYTDGQGITFNGIYLELKGTPSNGDSINIQPAQKTNVLDSAEKFAQLLEKASSLTKGQLADGLAAVQREMKSAMDNVGVHQSLMGSELNALDNREVTINSVSDSLETIRSGLEDLDYSKAITQYIQQKTAMQAAEQSFATISGLNLFNFLK